VTARLCQIAMEERVVAVLPADGREAGAQDAALVAEVFQIRVLRLPADLARLALGAALSGTLAGSNQPPVTADRESLRTARLRQRLHMAAAYFIADSMNYLVAGGLDRTDLTIGSFTRYGDAAADLLPLGNILKSDVLALANDLEVPRSIIDRAPAGSLPAGGERGESGLTHGDFERYLTDGPDGVAPATALKIERLMRASERQRGAPLMMEVE
jgi:NAD+ synthase